MTMAVPNLIQQATMSWFSPEIFQTLQKRYLEIVKSALYAPGIDPNEFQIHWAIYEQNDEKLMSLISPDLVRKTLIQKDKEDKEIANAQMLKEMNKSKTKKNSLKEMPEGFKANAAPVTSRDVGREISRAVNEKVYTRKYGLTPLHIAVMTNNLFAVKSLIATNKCKINEKDCLGATPIHHAAALGNREFIQLLVGAGADPSEEDNYGGTYKDLLDLFCPTIAPAAQRVFFQETDDKIVKKTGEAFYQRTHATLLDSELILSPLLWLENWKRSGDVSELTKLGIALQEKYFQFHSFLPPKVLIRKDPVIGHYLCAGEDISRFTIIGEYLGKIDTDELDKKQEIHEDKIIKATEKVKEEDEKQFVYINNPSVDYVLGAIDAYEFRGLMGFVSDSFPNVITIPLRATRGVHERVLFIAATKIKKGEVLAFDYGKEHQTKRMPFKELRQEAMEMFAACAEKTLKKIKSSGENDSLEEFLEFLSLRSRLGYLVHSPIAMLSLYLKRIVSIETLREISDQISALKDDDGGFGFVTKWHSPKSVPEKFLETLENFDAECTAERNIPFVKKAKTALLEMIGKKSTLEIYRFLDDPPPFKQKKN